MDDGSTAAQRERMASGVSGVRSSSSALARAGAGATTRAQVGALASAGAAVARTARSLAAVGAVSNLAARTAEGSALWIFVAAGEKELLMLGSQGDIGAGLTAYIGPSGLTSDEDRAFVAVPAGSVLEVYVSLDNAPGAGQMTVTLRREAADTAAVIVLTGADTVGAWTGEVAFGAEERLSFRVGASASCPAKTNVNIALKWQHAS